MEQRDDENKYVLVFKDDLCGDFWLEPSASANSGHVSEVLSGWKHARRALDVWISDQASHFKNEMLAHLANTHRIRHNLVVTYSPCKNGTV